MTVSTDVKNRQTLLRRMVAAAAFSVMVVGSAEAVTISPVTLELTPARRVVAVTVSNDSDTSIILQAETLAWTQPDGRDHEEITDDLLVAPPLAEIKPGKSQIFRVTLRRPTITVAERAYRLVLDDVSDIKKQNRGVGVTFNFSHRLPVFVAGTGKVGPAPHLGACTTPAPAGCVRLNNDGDRFVRVKSLSVQGHGWRRELDAGSRLLSGAWKQWLFDIPAKQAEPIIVYAETSAGPLSIKLPAKLR